MVWVDAGWLVWQRNRSKRTFHRKIARLCVFVVFSSCQFTFTSHTLSVMSIQALSRIICVCPRLWAQVSRIYFLQRSLFDMLTSSCCHPLPCSTNTHVSGSDSLTWQWDFNLSITSRIKTLQCRNSAGTASQAWKPSLLCDSDIVHVEHFFCCQDLKCAHRDVHSYGTFSLGRPKQRSATAFVVMRVNHRIFDGDQPTDWRKDTTEETNAINVQ